MNSPRPASPRPDTDPDQNDTPPPDAATPAPESAPAGPDPRASLEVRPTLVVGVGGTGCAAVKELKRRLRELAGCDVPFVAFAVVDTTTPDTIGEPIDEGDFINIGNVDFNDIVRNIRDYTHLESWFPHQSFKPMQLGFGAMGVRHIGRLCYFQWRETPWVLPKLRQKMEKLMSTELLDHTNRMEGRFSFRLVQNTGLDVHLIGSGAGGTGSGIFLDLAYDLRRLAKEAAKSTQLTGHILLPDAFEGVIPKNIMGPAYNNSHALLSEIDHFVDKGDWSADYKGGAAREERQAPCDIIYLLSRAAEDGIVRSRDELTAIIGAAVATLTFAQAAKSAKDASVNLLPSIMNTPDPTFRRNRCYGSYGVSVGVVDHQEILEHSAQALEKVLLERVTQAGPESRAAAESAARAFLAAAGLDEAKLEQRLPTNLQKFAMTAPTPPAAGVVRANAEKVHRKQRDDRIAQHQKEWSQAIEPVLAAVDRVKVANAAAALLFKTSTAADGAETFQLGVSDLASFAVALKNRLDQLHQWCAERAQAMSLQEQSAEADIQKIPANQATPLPADRFEAFVKTVRLWDEGATYRPLYLALGQRLKTVLNSLDESICDDIADLVRSFQRPAAAMSISERKPALPRIRMFEARHILTALQIDLHATEKQLRVKVAAALQGTDDSAEHEVLEPEQLAREIAERRAADALAARSSNGRVDPVELAAAVNLTDPDHLQKRLGVLHSAAQPALRCVERLARESIVRSGIVSAAPSSAIARFLRRIDTTMQGVASSCDDITIVRLVHGVPLWAIVNADEWEKAALETQTLQKRSHNFLHPDWARAIAPYTVMRTEVREEVWLFTMLLRIGMITNRNQQQEVLDRYLFDWKGANRFAQTAPRHRDAAFVALQQLWKTGRVARGDTRKIVDDFLFQQGGLLSAADLLEAHADNLRRVLDGLIANTRSTGEDNMHEIRADTTRLRQEIQVVEEEAHHRRLKGAT